MATKRSTAKKATATKPTATKPATPTARRQATKPTPKKTAARKTATSPRAARPTLATVSAKLDALAEQIAELVRVVSGGAAASRDVPGAIDPIAFDPSSVDGPQAGEDFEQELVALVTDLDRRGRHAGMVPIPDLRSAFLHRGWTRRGFDDRLLQAERDFIVDLKVADDPARLPSPDLAIQEPGRGYLQYVVVR